MENNLTCSILYWMDIDLFIKAEFAQLFQQRRWLEDVLALCFVLGVTRHHPSFPVPEPFPSLHVTFYGELSLRGATHFFIFYNNCTKNFYFKRMVVYF